MSRPSCYELALTLPALHREQNEMDIAFLRAAPGREKGKSECSFAAAYERRVAVQTLIRETPAVTMQDVAAQLLLAYAELADADEDETKSAERAILSSLFVVADAADVNLDDIGIHYLAPYAQRPRARGKEMEPA